MEAPFQGLWLSSFAARRSTTGLFSLHFICDRDDVQDSSKDVPCSDATKQRILEGYTGAEHAAAASLLESAGPEASPCVLVRCLLPVDDRAAVGPGDQVSFLQIDGPCLVSFAIGRRF